MKYRMKVNFIVVTITGKGTVTILVRDENMVTYAVTFTIDLVMEYGNIVGNFFTIISDIEKNHLHDPQVIFYSE